MALVERDGVGIWYEVTGSGQPLVLSGGFGLLDSQWNNVREHLVSRFQVIDWNYRGVGRSDRSWAGAAAHQDMWVDDLAAVIDELDLRDVILWGTSTGSPTTIRYVARYPGRVRAMITYPMFKADVGFRAAFDGFTTVGETFGYDALACLTSWIGCAEENLFTERQGKMARWESECFQRNFDMATLAETMRIVALNDFTADLDKITVPTLLLMGQSGHLGYDAPGNRALADEFCERVAHAEQAIIPGGGGTYCMIEVPVPTAQAVIDFVYGLAGSYWGDRRDSEGCL